MLFTSPIFIIFFAIYFCLHLIVPTRYRISLIIVGSAIFYSWWKFEYFWLPFFLMAISYGGVYWAMQTDQSNSRKWRMAATISVLFIPLAIYKYANFIHNELIVPFLENPGKLFDFPLPLGISFVTFTLTAYVVDVCRGKFPFEHRFSSLLAYVLFFPHLIAGPILRPHELIPQINKPRSARQASFTLGFAIFSVGLIKKIIFADQIAESVEAVYNAASQSTQALDYLLAIYGFSVQIYCDFSGYTDMAIGLAIVLGIRLPNNFERPYASLSIIEFWRRWHITLSSWLRDYLYITMGGNRHGTLMRMRNLVVTMALGGLWHGANWTFVIWGLAHGFGLAFVQAFRRLPGAQTIPNWISMVLTFHFVTFNWILFRSTDLTTSKRIFMGPFTGKWDNAAGFFSSNIFPVILVGLFFLLHHFDTHSRVRLAVRKMPKAVSWVMMGMIWLIAATVSAGSSSKFIYFDF